MSEINKILKSTIKNLIVTDTIESSNKVKKAKNYDGLISRQVVVMWVFKRSFIKYENH